jgi:hypothetical protein
MTGVGYIVSAFLYLLLAHLVADFILQPYQLVKLKTRPIGLGIHAGIHSVLTVLLVAPFMPRWVIIVPALGVVHYFVDQAKVAAGVDDGPASFAVFLADQVVHVGALAAAVLAAGLSFTEEVVLGTPGLTAALYYAIPYVGATFAGAIVVFQVAVAYRTRGHPGDLLKPALRLAGYVERGAVLTGILFFGPASWWLAALWYGGRVALGRGRAGLWLETGAGAALTVALGFLFRQGGA